MIFAARARHARVSTVVVSGDVAGLIASSQEYIGLCKLRQLLSATKDIKNWCEGIPDNASDVPELQKWKKSPKKAEAMCAAIGALLFEQSTSSSSHGDKSARSLFQKS